MQINADYMESGNYIKKTYLGERGVANILLSSNINGEFSICLEDEQNGVKSSWEMIMCEKDAKKVALRLAKITGIVSLDATANNTLPADRWGKWIVSEIQCPNCFEYFDTDCYSHEELNKCPICHKDMRGVQND